MLVYWLSRCCGGYGGSGVCGGGDVMVWLGFGVCMKGWVVVVIGICDGNGVWK